MRFPAFTRFSKTLLALAVIVVLSLAGVSPAQVRAAQPAVTPAASRAPGAFPTNQIIVKYKASSSARMHPATAGQMQRLSQAAGVSLKYRRAMSGGAHVLRLPASLPLDQVQAIASRLMASSDVQYAVPDRRLFPALDASSQPARPAYLTPNDTDYANQWYLTGTWGINAPAAWDYTTGSSSVVVAVLDTGITTHAEFNGRIVTGYDFVSDPATAIDGDPDNSTYPNRDANPSDPGDWVTSGDSAAAGTCNGFPVTQSTWHGTHSAGIIAASGDNGQGVAGLNWSAKILPVRVLGKCGGAESDAIDAMRWSAGISISGVPDNAHPAKVINLSAGAKLGGCDVAFQTAVDDVVAAGALVVVSAGNYNFNLNTDPLLPASCSNLISVGAIGLTGGQAFYSDYGTAVTISAPGGDQNHGLSYGIFSTVDTGTQGPTGDGYDYQMGTSESAPQVSGVASLLFSLKPSLTPAQVRTILQDSARAFPASPAAPSDTDTACTTSTCGAGILDAGAAISNLLTNYDAGTPSVTLFGVTTPSASLAIPITTFSASDDLRVTGYMVTTSSTPPLAAAGGWSATAPTSFTDGAEGPHILYPWVKDMSSHVSVVYGSPIHVTVDTTAPTVTAFSAPAHSSSLAIPLSSFSASDTVGVTGYLVTTSSTPPVSGDIGWTVLAPTIYTVPSDGTYTLYPWAKDVVGHVSAPFGAPASVIVDTAPPSVVSSLPAGPNPTALGSVDFTVTFSEPVSGVDTTDFGLTTSGVSGAAISAVSGSGAVYTVTVGTGTGNGSISLDVLDNHDILDNVGNLLSAAFSSGQAYTVNKPITLTLKSIGAQDGWVLESSENSSKGGSLNSIATSFRLGDDAANRQYRAILSFNTVLPVNATIQSAQLKIKQTGAALGSNPFSVLGSLWADIRKGPFGTSVLALTDFNAAASAAKVGAFNKTPAGGWYTDTLSAAGLARINFSGLTQFRLYFAKDDNNNHKADFMQFVSGNGSASFQPQLVIIYTLP